MRSGALVEVRIFRKNEVHPYRSMPLDRKLLSSPPVDKRLRWENPSASNGWGQAYKPYRSKVGRLPFPVFPESCARVGYVLSKRGGPVSLLLLNPRFQITAVRRESVYLMWHVFCVTNTSRSMVSLTLLLLHNIFNNNYNSYFPTLNVFASKGCFSFCLEIDWIFSSNLSGKPYWLDIRF